MLDLTAFSTDGLVDRLFAACTETKPNPAFVHRLHCELTVRIGPRKTRAVLRAIVMGRSYTRLAAEALATRRWSEYGKWCGKIGYMNWLAMWIATSADQHYRVNF